MVSKKTRLHQKKLEGNFYRYRITRNPTGYTDVHLWNKVFNDCESYADSREWLSFMIKCGVEPNINTYNKILRKTESVEDALEVLHEMALSRINEDIWTTNIIIHMWTHTFDAALAIYTDAPCEPNLVTFHVMSDKADTPQEMYQLMTLMDQHSFDYTQRVWNKLIAVSKRSTEAQRYYALMQRCGVKPSNQTKRIMQRWLTHTNIIPQVKTKLD